MTVAFAGRTAAKRESVGRHELRRLFASACLRVVPAAPSASIAIPLPSRESTNSAVGDLASLSRLPLEGRS